MAEFDSVVQRKQCLLIQVQDRVAQLQSQIHTLQSFLINGHAHDDVLNVRAQCENFVLALNKQIHTNGEW